MKTTKAEITLSNGDIKIRVDTVVRHELVQQVFNHLLTVITDIDFNGTWKLENILFREEATNDPHA